MRHCITLSALFLSLGACTAYTNRVCTDANRVEIGLQGAYYAKSGSSILGQGTDRGFYAQRIGPAYFNVVVTDKAGDSVAAVHTCQVLGKTWAEFRHPYVRDRYTIFQVIPQGPKDDPYSKLSYDPMTTAEGHIRIYPNAYQKLVEFADSRGSFGRLQVDLLDNRNLSNEEFLAELKPYVGAELGMTDNGSKIRDPINSDYAIFVRR